MVVSITTIVDTYGCVYKYLYTELWGPQDSQVSLVLLTIATWDCKPTYSSGPHGVEGVLYRTNR